MGLFLDIHLHTKRYSACSQIDPSRLIAQAIAAGVDGLVITEHHQQWPQDELDALVKQSGHLGFLVLSGFEYTSNKGDLLIYGVPAHAVASFKRGWEPAEAIRIAHEFGAVCVAAHPTRAGMGFDERLLTLKLAAMEVCSVNMQEHERKLAAKIAQTVRVPGIAASDAHVLRDVGRFTTEFLDPIQNMPDLQKALKHGRFQVAPCRQKGT